MILTSLVDAWVDEAATGANHASTAKLWVDGGAGSNNRYSFLRFGRKPPAGAKVISAVLRLRLSGAWAGSHDLTVKRVTQEWKEGTITWANKPSVSATHLATETVSAGVDKQVVELDVTDMMQDVADGSTFWGFRLETPDNVSRALRSSEDASAAYRPQLEITWSEAPEPADRLHPDEEAVSSDSPVLAWRFRDKIGTGAGLAQASSRVQLAVDPADLVGDPGSPDYDTMKQTNSEQHWDLSLDGGWDGSLLDDGDTLYWRVMTWDGTDFASEWSEVAELSRDDLGSLSLDEPGGTVPETTPPIIWTLTGATQARYTVTLYTVAATGALDQVWQTSDQSTDNSVTPDSGLIQSGKTYRVKVEVWDDATRYGDDHLTVTGDFTYVRDNTPDPVGSITAVAQKGSPEVIIHWTRTVAPDYFCLVVDGVEVLDFIDPADVLVATDNYELGYWGATPREPHTYEVEAVVLDTGKYLHSGPNPEADATTNPVGIWLVDEDDGTAVQIVGKESADFGIGETGTTYYPIGAKRPVRITDVIRGYEGPIKGQLLDASERDDFLELKGRLKALTLIVGDLAIPIRMEEASCTPTAVPGDTLFAVAFNFFQVGAPWPVDTTD